MPWCPSHKKNTLERTTRLARSRSPIIRESVDSLYMDDTDEISRDPRTKRLKTRRESLPRPSKHTSNSLRAHIYLYMFPKISNAPSVIHERIRSYAISRFRVIIFFIFFFFFFFFFKPAISLPVPVQALIFSLRSPISPEVCPDIKRSFLSCR